MKIHTQILIALVAGALFGAIFHADPTALVIVHKVDHPQKKLVIQNWQSVEIRVGDITGTFSARQVPALLIYWRSLNSEQKDTALMIIRTDSENPAIVVDRIRQIHRKPTIATGLRPLGTIFIRLLNMIAIPLVFASLLVGAASLGDIRKLARIGSKTIFYFLITTAIAISIGLVLVNIIRPGEQVSPAAKHLLMAESQPDIKSRIEERESIKIADLFIHMIPANPVQALAEGNMLQIVFFAVLLGMVLTFIRPEKSKPVTGFFDGISEAMIALVQKVMLIAPYAVFALIAATVSEFGFEILRTLIWYVGCVVAGLLIHLCCVYPLFIKAFSKMPLRQFFTGIRPAQLVAFTTSSSAAALPVNFECCEKNLRVPKHITSFVLPLGATINMDGTALYQGIAVNFIAQVYGIDLSITQQLTILMTALLASIGTAPVPGVGIVMLIIVLRSVHVPEEGIALILGVDRFLDMCRTMLNITGDATGSVVVAASEEKKH